MKIGDLLNLALKDAGVIGVGQTASAEDRNDALTTLNMMLDTWAVERLMVYQLIETSAAVTGSQTMTLGAGGDINTPWPERIENMFFRLGTVDYPVRERTKQEFDGISFKQVSTIPQVYWNDRAFPVSTLHFFPIPVGGTIFVTTWAPVQQFDSSEDSVTFPPGYMEAIRYGLASRMAAIYGLAQQAATLSPIETLAKRRIKQSNVRIPQLSMPAALQRDGRFAGPAGFLAGD